MKLLAALFGGTALLAALLGFAMDLAPVLSLCAKVTAVMAMAGLAITAGTNTAKNEFPPFDFDADTVGH